MPRPRKARVEGSVAAVGAPRVVPVASEDFASFVELFKREHADEWESMRLCPLESGLAVMVERLK